MRTDAGACYSVVTGKDADGNDKVTFNCQCNLGDGESKAYSIPQDALATMRHRLQRVLDYCQGKRTYHPSLGVAEMSLAERMHFLASIPHYKPTSSQNYHGVVFTKDNLKQDLTSLNEALPT